MSKNELGDGRFIDKINIDSIGLELFIDSDTGEFKFDLVSLVLNGDGGFDEELFEHYVISNKIGVCDYSYKYDKFCVADLDGTLYWVNNDVAKVFALLNNQIECVNIHTRNLYDYILHGREDDEFDSVLFMEKFLENFTKMEEQVDIIKDSDFVLLPEHISDDLWCKSPEPDLLEWVCGE